MGVAFFYLKGQTSASERVKLCHRFKEKEGARHVPHLFEEVLRLKWGPVFVDIPSASP
jgi:hypothetical protein